MNYTTTHPPTQDVVEDVFSFNFSNHPKPLRIYTVCFFGFPHFRCPDIKTTEEML